MLRAMSGAEMVSAGPWVRDVRVEDGVDEQVVCGVEFFWRERRWRSGGRGCVVL